MHCWVPCDSFFFAVFMSEVGFVLDLIFQELLVVKTCELPLISCF